MKIIRTYPYGTCNKKMLFVKKYLSLLWVFTDFSILLVAFWTSIIRQLIRTARTLEAEWWQVCREVWVWVQGKISQVLGTFEPLDFTMLWPVLNWHVFWNLGTIHFFNFPIFFRAAVNGGYLKLQILNLWIRGSACTFHSYFLFLIYSHSSQNKHILVYITCYQPRRHTLGSCMNNILPTVSSSWSLTRTVNGRRFSLNARKPSCSWSPDFMTGMRLPANSMYWGFPSNTYKFH